jgi:hypothetical protein
MEVTKTSIPEKVNMHAVYTLKSFLLVETKEIRPKVELSCQSIDETFDPSRNNYI